MTKFDLKKIIAENKATFFSSINEGYDEFERADKGSKDVTAKDKGEEDVYGAGVKKGEEIEKKKLSEGSASSFEEWLKGIQIAYPEIAKEFEKYGLDKAKSKEEFINIVKSKGTLYNPDLNFYKLGNKIGTSDKRIELSQDNTTFGDYANENDNRIVPSKTDWKSIVKPSRNIMTKEELKRKIKEMIMAEDTINVEDPAELDTFYTESKINEAITADMIQKKYNEMFGKNPQTTFADVAKALGTTEQEVAAVLFKLPMFEAKKDEETTDAPEVTDVEISAEETPTSDSFEVSTSEVDPTIKAIQDALTQAQAAAQKLGDEKLTDQIGNTITFFTRTHIANKDVAPVAEELEENFINKMKFRAGIIK